MSHAQTDSDTPARFDLRENLPFSADKGVGGRGRIGLIVLSGDLTVEHEFRTVLPADGVALYQSRIFCDTQITPQTLAAMEPRIASAVDLLVPGLALDVVGFGCTSASMVLGEEAIFARIREVRPDVACTTPITAAFAAFEQLGARRLAVLTPYRRDVNETVRSYLEGRGMEVPVLGSFNEEDDGVVGRIDVASIRRAALELGARDDVDAVFVSCTSLRLVEVAAAIEAELGKPVTSSNHALAWHCLRLAGIDDALPFGRLYSLPASA